MADMGSLRQAGGARRVDQQRAIIDRDRPSLVARQRLSTETRDRAVDAGSIPTAMTPELRRGAEPSNSRPCCLFIFSGDDDVFRSGNREAVRERGSGKLRVEQS